LAQAAGRRRIHGSPWIFFARISAAPLDKQREIARTSRRDMNLLRKVRLLQQILVASFFETSVLS
jgi:hypothetical protein